MEKWDEFEEQQKWQIIIRKETEKNIKLIKLKRSLTSKNILEQKINIRFIINYIGRFFFICMTNTQQIEQFYCPNSWVDKIQTSAQFNGFYMCHCHCWGLELSTLDIP